MGRVAPANARLARLSSRAVPQHRGLATAPEHVRRQLLRHFGQWQCVPLRATFSANQKHPNREETQMNTQKRLRTKQQAAALLFLLAAAASAHAQQAGGLDEKQTQGRQLFAQSCGICHLQAVRGTNRYGPVLSKAATAGNDDVMRALILEGSERMPAFKYYLKANEIDAIIAYVRTVPAPAATTAQK
jgi:mono/diheme cytochrome c family protein